MKKLVLLIFFLLILCGCKNKTVDETIEYLNKNDAAVYLYSKSVKDDFGMDIFMKINSFDSEQFTHAYSCIIIDIEPNRLNLNEKVVDSLYDLLLKENKVMIIFYEGENYNFFKNTGFANEKDYYDNVAQICSYNNFNKEIKESFSDTNLKSYRSCLIHLESKIKEYRGSL